MSSAPNSGGVLRSFASAHDGSRVERELSSPYNSSAFPQVHSRNRTEHTVSMWEPACKSSEFLRALLTIVEHGRCGPEFLGMQRDLI